MAGGQESSTRRGLPRAAIAVAALYALVLQAFLAALMPLPAAADGLCALHAQETGAPDEAPTRKAPAHADGACCVAAQTVVGSLQPREGPTPAAWPRARAFRPPAAVAAVRARAPPDRGASPRGPPAA